MRYQRVLRYSKALERLQRQLKRIQEALVQAGSGNDFSTTNRRTVKPKVYQDSWERGESRASSVIGLFLFLLLVAGFRGSTSLNS